MKRPFHKNTISDIYFYSLSPHRNYVWLSNFAYTPFQAEGVEWPTVENYFQAHKTHNEQVRGIIRRMLPWEAKKYGRQVDLRPDWEQVKETVMFEGTMCKYEQNPQLRKLLIQTYPAKIHEDSPNDLYWGVWGLDRLGRIIEMVRAHLMGLPTCDVKILARMADENRSD